MQKRKTGSRITALLLAVFMFIAYMPLLGSEAYAAEDDETSLSMDKTVYEYTNWSDPSFKVKAKSNKDGAWVGIYQGNHDKTYDFKEAKHTVYKSLGDDLCDGTEFDILQNYDGTNFHDSTYWYFPSGEYTLTLFHTEGSNDYVVDKVYPFTIAKGNQYRLEIVADEVFNPPLASSGTIFKYGVTEGNIKVKTTIPESTGNNVAWVGIAQVYAGNWTDYANGSKYVNVSDNGGEVDITDCLSYQTGTYRITLYSSGYYPEDVEYVYFRPDASQSVINLDKTTFEYNGKAQKPTVVSVGSHPSFRYTVEYENENSTNPGTYKVWAKFHGGFGGTAETEYTITPCSHSSLTHTEAKAETCTEDGNYEYWTCDNCGIVFGDSAGAHECDETEIVIPAKNHDYDNPTYAWKEDGSSCVATVVCKNDATHKITEEGTIKSTIKTPATCETKGTTTYTATFTNSIFSEQSKDIEDIGETEHKWGEWTQTKAPTCSAKGEEERICENDSNHKETRDVAIDPEAHTWDEGKVTTEPTCTEKGTKTFTCILCKETKTEDIAALGHKLTETAAKEATTTEEGNDAYWACSECGKFFSDSEGKTEIEKDSWIIPKKDEPKPVDPSTPDEAIAEARAELKTFIDEVSNLEQGDHSDEEFHALQEALKEAQAVYNDSNATEEQLKAATDALFEAEYKYIVGEEYKNEESSNTDGKTIKTIIAKAKEKLQSVVEKAKQYINDKDKYTEESYKKFEEAVNKAKAAAEKADASVAELENVKKAVTDAVKDLKEKEDSQTEEGKAAAAAKETLKKALEEARNAIKGATSDDSEQAGALREAIDKASKIFENDKATAAELTKALSDIESARKAYTEKKATKEALNKTVEDAKKIEQGNYTDESFKALQDAIAEAEKVANDPKATSADLKAAEDKVAAAKAALKEKETEPAKKVIKVGTVEKYKSNAYKVTSTKSKTVSLKKAKNVKTVAIPATVKLSDGKTYKVTAVEASAFTAKKIRNVTIGKNVKKIKANAFKKSKATTVTLKTKLLKKSTVKNSLKGSVVKTVKVRITKKASSKTNKTYIKKYKKYFTKANAGRKVTVK